MSLLKTAILYTAGQIASLYKEAKTSLGVTDDLEPETPAQVSQVMSGSTDAREAANIVFASTVKLPAEIMAVSDFYDMTQGVTRINDIYAMTREDYYLQYAEGMESRKNRLENKQARIGKCVMLCEEPKRIIEEMASV